MIIQKPYTKGDVVSFKISSGEEIISRLNEDDNLMAHDFHLIKPVVLMPSPNGLSMMPALLSADKDLPLKLNKSLVLYYGKTSKEIADEYMRATTNIATPPKGLIV